MDVLDKEYWKMNNEQYLYIYILEVTYLFQKHLNKVFQVVSYRFFYVDSRYDNENLIYPL